MTIDGFCDHTVLLPDEEIHQHHTELLKSPEMYPPTAGVMPTVRPAA